MPQCTSVCIDDLAIPSLAQLCGMPEARSECPSKLLFFTCDTAIPTGNAAAIGAALDGLIDTGNLGATGHLRNFQFADPTTTDLTTADCYPAYPITTQRDLTFEDYNSIDVASDGTTPQLYADRDFWNLIVSSGQKFYFGYTTCDGKLYLYTRDRAYTQWMTGIIQVFQRDDRTIANQCQEVKAGTIRFLGDPKQYFPKPYVDLAPLVATIPLLATLY